MTHYADDETLDEIKRLQDQVAALTKERDAERYKHEQAVTINERLLSDIRCSKAREEKLRTAMLSIANYCRIWGGEAERARKLLEHYLALPTDDTAL